MLTKKQIEQAAKQYCQENNGDAFEYHAFWNGAEWAAEQMLAENEKMLAALEAIIDRYDVANMLAGDDPIIEQARKVLE